MIPEKTMWQRVSYKFKSLLRFKRNRLRVKKRS
jgi:hypothetical protein